MAEWRIYYGDGTTVEGTTRAEWTAAPSANVQVVVARDPLPLDSPRNIGRVVFYGSPYYIWGVSSPIPTSADGVGLLDDLLARGLIADTATVEKLSLRNLTAWGVKIGRTIAIQSFDDILVAAINAPGFPIKSGTRPGEDALAEKPVV
ncbi:MAG: hypothetical protein ACSLFM_07855 [Tepidiformaceae bacterium]